MNQKCSLGIPYAKQVAANERNLKRYRKTMTPKEEQKHTDLLPCPFCGGAPKIWCGEPCCETCGIDMKTPALWNTRKADCHEEVVGWLPIETAPKEQTRGILVIGPEWSEPMIYWWDFMKNHWVDLHSPDTIASLVTHWMPLPAAPLARATNHQESGEKK